MKHGIACLALLVCLTFIVVSIGCHRGYYRRQADAEARALIREKLNDPRWSGITPTIEIAPESRMFDNFSADHPPMPPDDPASHEYMHCVDDKQGYLHWHANGDTRYVANPEWLSYMPLNERGVLELDINEAVRLSLIHSATLQEQRETLYLSALDVSLERFAFDVQGTFGWDNFFRTQGRSAPGGTSSTFDSAARGGLTKLGVTGAQLAADFANSVIWQFSGPTTQSATALVDFSLIQPLLRGAGREIIMEQLTQAERTLLSNVRALERFRRSFNLFVTTGRGGLGGLRRVGLFLNEPGGSSINIGGYLGLLQTQQEIRISEFNVRSLENVLNQFNEFFREQRSDLLQVRQAENTLYDAQERLLRDKVRYQNQLDQFKRDLGLPPDLPIEIVDPYLDQFNLVDDDLQLRQFEVEALRQLVGDALQRINPDSEDGSFGEEDTVEWSEELARALQDLLPVIRASDPLYEQLTGPDLQMVLDDFDKFEAKRDQRLDELEKLRNYIRDSEIDYEIEPKILEPGAVESVGQLRSELEELTQKIQQLRGSVRVLESNIQRLLEDGPGLAPAELKRRLESEVVFEAPELLTRAADAIIELTLLQARARTNAITLPEVDIDSYTAVAIACQFRRDLMNARASLVDSWRQIQFVADDLESTLDVVFEGSVGSTAGASNPFQYNWNTNSFGMGLEFDAPITRVSERNRYRETLIEYQQTRRDFYEFEDAIKQDLRLILRNLEQSKVLFELQRRSIKTAIEQVELARFRLVEPVQPGGGGLAGGGRGLGATAARDLTGALNTLQSAQSNFLREFVTYEALRRDLDLDMGTMQLGVNGEWLDPGTITAEYAYRAAAMMGIPPESVCMPPESELLNGFVPVEIEPAPAQLPGANDEPFDMPDIPQADFPQDDQ
ncbi:MAG: TolC family protein [Pirellulaceae bacterium]